MAPRKSNNDKKRTAPTKAPESSVTLEAEPPKSPGLLPILGAVAVIVVVVIAGLSWLSFHLASTLSTSHGDGTKRFHQTSIEDEMEKSRLRRRYEDWFRENAWMHPNLTLTRFPEGNGIRVTGEEPMERGTTLLKVPEHLQITRQNSIMEFRRAVATASAAEKQVINRLLGSSLMDEDILTLRLLYEHSLGTSSRFYIYLSMLPKTEMPLLFTFNDKELAYLNDQNLVALAKKTVSRIGKVWQAIQPALKILMPDQQETKLPLQKQFGFVTVFGKNQIRTACPDSPYLDAQKLTDFSLDILHHPNDADSKSASKGKGKCDKRGNTRLEDGKASNQSCIINDIGLPAPATRVIPKEVNKNLLYSYRVGLSALARQVMTEITTPSRFQPYALARLAKLEEEDPTGKFLFDSNYHALNGLLARNVTATHVDNLNCGKPGMGYVLTVISVVLLNEIAYRSSGISASRASVGIHQAQDGCCRPFLTMLYEWYDSLPLEQKEITRNLLHSSADPIAKGPSQAPVDIPVHMDKCLMYSNVLGIVANTCAKLNYLNAGDSSNEFVNAILFSCLLTNNMNYSWEFSQELMNGGIPRPKDGVSLVQAAIAYYKKISQQIKSKMRRPSKGARHQPHSGKCEFTAEEIAGALQRIADVRVAISSSSTFTSADYNKASDLAMLVPCVGDFLKHTVVVVLAMLACKTGYLHHEDIVSPKTQTGKRLMEVLVFSEEAPDKEQSSSTLVALIKAITRRCKCTSIAAENMICEYFRNQGKNKRVIRDLRLPGVPLVFYYIPKAQWSVWVHSSSAPVSLENYILSLGIMSRYGKQNFHSQISDINSPIAKKTRSSRQTSLAVIKHAASTSRKGGGPHLRSCSISASSLSDSDSLSSRSDNVQPVLPGHAHLSQKPLASYPCVQTNLNELLAAILGYHGNFVLKDAVTFCTKRISELKQRKGSKAPNTCHSVAFSACLVCASGNVCHYSASSSPAIHLFDRYCLFTSKDGKVFFQDKFTSIKYAIWSTLLQDSNAQHLQTFLAGLFDLPLFPLSEENDPDRVDSPGRLLLQPYARDRSSSHSYVVQRDSQHYEVGLISKKGHRLGSGVIITPP